MKTTKYILTNYALGVSNNLSPASPKGKEKIIKFNPLL